MRKYMIAMVQMDTQNDKGENLRQAEAWIDEAASMGARLVCFPEVMNLIGRNVGEGGGREQIPGYTTEILCKKAKEHGIYIHGGSITEERPGEKRSANTSVLISPEGEILAKYSKLHMFDIVPASFTMPTGKDHWEPLLRARAIENGCYIVAPGQIGKKPAYVAYGNSLVADPWGTVVARAKDAPGITYAEIDLDYLDQIRKQIPSLENRRTDLYSVKNTKE